MITGNKLVCNVLLDNKRCEDWDASVLRMPLKPKDALYEASGLECIQVSEVLDFLGKIKHK